MRRKSYWSSDLDEEIVQQDLTVFEAELSPIDTGVLDCHGNPIMRAAERGPIGFPLVRPRVRVKAGRRPIG